MESASDLESDTSSGMATPISDFKLVDAPAAAPSEDVSNKTVGLFHLTASEGSKAVDAEDLPSLFKFKSTRKSDTEGKPNEEVIDLMRNPFSESEIRTLADLSKAPAIDDSTSDSPIPEASVAQNHAAELNTTASPAPAPPRAWWVSGTKDAKVPMRRASDMFPRGRVELKTRPEQRNDACSKFPTPTKSPFVPHQQATSYTIPDNDDESIQGSLSVQDSSAATRSGANRLPLYPTMSSSNRYRASGPIQDPSSERTGGKLRMYPLAPQMMNPKALTRQASENLAAEDAIIEQLKAENATIRKASSESSAEVRDSITVTKNLSDQLAAQAKSIEQLETRLSSSEKETATLRNSNSSLEEKVEVLSKSNTSLKKKVKTLRGTNSSLEGKIEHLSGMQKLQQTTSSAQQGHLDSLDNFIRPKAKDLDGSMNSLTQRMTAVESESMSSKNAVEKNAEDCKSQLGNLKIQTSNLEISTEWQFNEFTRRLEAAESAASLDETISKEQLTALKKNVDDRLSKLETTAVDQVQRAEARIGVVEFGVQEIEARLNDLKHKSLKKHAHLDGELDCDMRQIKKLQDGLAKIEKTVSKHIDEAKRNHFTHHGKISAIDDKIKALPEQFASITVKNEVGELLQKWKDADGAITKLHLEIREVKNEDIPKLKNETADLFASIDETDKNVYDCTKDFQAMKTATNQLDNMTVRIEALEYENDKIYGDVAQLKKSTQDPKASANESSAPITTFSPIKPSSTSTKKNANANMVSGADPEAIVAAQCRSSEIEMIDLTEEEPSGQDNSKTMPPTSAVTVSMARNPSAPFFKRVVGNKTAPTDGPAVKIAKESNGKDAHLSDDLETVEKKEQPKMSVGEMSRAEETAVRGQDGKATVSDAADEDELSEEDDCECLACVMDRAEDENADEACSDDGNDSDELYA